MLKVLFDEYDITTWVVDYPSFKLSYGVENNNVSQAVQISIVNQNKMFSEFNRKSMFYHNPLSDYVITIKDDYRGNILTAPIIDVEEDKGIATLTIQKTLKALDMPIENMFDISLEDLFLFLPKAGFDFDWCSVQKVISAFHNCRFAVIQSDSTESETDKITYRELFTQLTERLGIYVFFNDKVHVHLPEPSLEYNYSLELSDCISIKKNDSRDMQLTNYSIKIYADDVPVKDKTDGLAINKDVDEDKIWQVDASQSGLIMLNRETATTIGDCKLKMFINPFSILEIEVSHRFYHVNQGDHVLFEDKIYVIMEVEYDRLIIKLTLWAC